LRLLRANAAPQQPGGVFFKYRQLLQMKRYNSVIFKQ